MKKIAVICICLCVCMSMTFSQEKAVTQEVSFGQDFVQGLEAYRVGNWEDALFFLKRTSNFQGATSDAVWYFVIMAEINMGDYAAALRDGTTFLDIFKESLYIPEITYQTLYASYEMGMYEQAITGFSQFIKSYPNHELVSSALFFSAESLYTLYDFDNAKLYYNTLLAQYPNSPKKADALFRLELLQQREREEKLLYLLRVTGEEAVAAKEDYERQIKQLQSEEALILRKRVQELELEQSRLLVEKEELLMQNETLKDSVQELTVLNEKNATMLAEQQEINESAVNNMLIDDLSQKALELQKLIESN